MAEPGDVPEVTTPLVETGGHSASESPHSKCTCLAKEGRNLVVCIDGTSNKFSKQVRSQLASLHSTYIVFNLQTQNTNVVELYSRLEKNRDQLTFYNSGIGTYATPSWRSMEYWLRVAESKVDLAIALYVQRAVRTSDSLTLLTTC